MTKQLGNEEAQEHERKIEVLRQALIDGENSGDAGELDMASIKDKARANRSQSASSQNPATRG